MCVCVCASIFGGAEDEREFEYAEKSEKGPRKWGRLKKEWIACNNGDMQSPINLSKHKLIIIPKKELNIKYRPSNATLNNRGHDIQVTIYIYIY